jgi:hypothetical protein
MAFNVLNTFQRNKRFWMAVVLMICMVSFVFCTGTGDMGEKISRWTSNRGGPAVVEIDGRSIGVRDLTELKMQRNLANTFMKHCADMALKTVSKKYFEMSKDAPNAKDAETRAQQLTQLLAMRSTLGLRKGRPRYFDGGVKFDDLVEFKLWQAEADRLGIVIEDEHLNFLFGSEFFHQLGRDELFLAQREAQREFRDASDTYVRRAIAEEFRVKIAQYAVLGAQPYSYLFRRKQGQGGDSFTFKFTDPNVPDETRAPLTLGQLWDFYKANRAEFNVTLIPLDVEDFTKNKFDFATKVPEPDELQKKEFFEANKNDSFDPSSDKRGLEIPPQSKFEYVIANPESDDYLNQAKAVALLEALSPFIANPTESPFVNLATYAANGQASKLALWKTYKLLNPAAFRTTGYDAPGSTTSILARLAKRHPQAAASVVGEAFLPPLDALGALASYQAWGTTKYPLTSTEGGKSLTGVPNWEPTWWDSIPPDQRKPPQEIERIAYAELQRRVPLYIGLVGSGANSFPLDSWALPYVAMNPVAMVNELTYHNETVPENIPLHMLGGFEFGQGPYFTVEAVQRELREMLARRTAEEWAQQNIITVKQALDQTGRDADKFKRELRKFVKEMKLTHGPQSEAKKDTYYNRFTIDGADEFETLKESYLKYMDQINLFEGRDVTGRVLKATDYNKIFFDPTEPFSATAKYQAMPWPPEVKPNNARELQFVNARLKQNVPQEALMSFEKHIHENDPNRPAPALQLYKTAAKPILFWRTTEVNATRPNDYQKIVKDLKDLQKIPAKLAAIDAKLKTEKDQKTISELKTQQDKLKRDETFLKKLEPDWKLILQRVTDGWKFERARKDAALPTAQKIASILITKGNNQAAIQAEAAKLNKETILLSKLSPMHQERIADNAMDYFPPPLPKDKIKPNDYPRENMMEQILGLYDLKKPIETGNKELDKANADLYQLTKDQKVPDKDRFVQILANKPRSIFYVAVVTSSPKADPLPFFLAMIGAPFPEIRQDKLPVPRDHFIDRAQEQEAKLYRVEFMRGLGEAHNFKVIDSDARKAFDDRGGD